MSALTSLLDAPATTVLAWTLLHFLWQGGVLALVFVLLIRAGRLTASGRYAAGVTTLALMLAAPLLTYAALANGAAPLPVAETADVVSAPRAALEGAPVDSAAVGESRASLAANLSLTAMVVAIWAGGVLVLAVRLAGGWCLARRLVGGGAAPVAPEIAAMATRLAGRLALDRIVRVAQSSSVSVPVMVGWLRPVVLFPASVLAGLSPTQIEALLAHELAHVRRHDYLVNLLQSAVETLLFYHPAVWWVSRQVRIEREHCCDDLAIGVCDPLVYATALSELAALSSTPTLALAATDGSLLQRVRRILGGGEPEHGTAWLPVLAVMFMAGVLVPVVVLSEAATIDPVQEIVALQNVSDGARRDNGGVKTGVAGRIGGHVNGAVTADVTAAAVEVVPDASVFVGEMQDDQARRRAAMADEVRMLIRAVTEDRAREAAQAQQEAELTLRELDRARQTIEQERLNARARHEMAQLEAALEALTRDHAAQKALVAAGQLSQAELVKVEREIDAMRRKLEALRVEQNLERRQLELQRQQRVQRDRVEQILTERPRVAREQVERRADLQAEVARRQRDEAARRQLSEVARDRLTAAAETLRRGTVLAAEEPIRAGDVLLIEIEGEPDVPRAYTVTSNGTIKLPLSAPMRVIGVTAPGVADLIVKQLSGRGLEGATVAVSARRPR